MEMIKSYILGFLAVFIATIAQVLLKKEANVKHESFLQKFLNVKVISAYSIFLLSTILNVVAFKNIDLKYAVVFDVTGFIWIGLFSVFILLKKLHIMEPILFHFQIQIHLCAENPHFTPKPSTKLFRNVAKKIYLCEVIVVCNYFTTQKTL